MSWPSIQSNDFLSMDGYPTKAQQKFEILMRPGINGVGFRKTGSRAEPYQLTTVTDLSTLSAASNKYNVYTALVGQRVSVTTPDGNAHGAMFVHLVQMVKVEKVATATPGPNSSTPGALMTCVWVLQHVG